jgi:hypothetical protein
MPCRAKPSIGGLYFLITFADDAYTRPMIRSCEYLGKSDDPESQHLFK